jgi:hypothetical protein
MMSQKIPQTQKRYSLFVLAILLLLLGGAALSIGPKYSAIRSFAGVAFIVAVYLIRVSNVHTRSTLAVSSNPASNRPGRLMWIVGFALLVVLGISFLYLYKDALDGYHEVLPVYLFAGVGIACAGVWGYIASKLV